MKQPPSSAPSADRKTTDPALPKEGRAGAAAGPVDGDWPDRERAAEGLAPADSDDDEADDAHGDAKDVQDEGVLESLGKAISSPVREASEEDEPAKGHSDVS